MTAAGRVRLHRRKKRHLQRKRSHLIEHYSLLYLLPNTRETSLVYRQHIYESSILAFPRVHSDEQLLHQVAELLPATHEASNFTRSIYVISIGILLHWLISTREMKLIKETARKRGRSFESAREIAMNCIVKATSELWETARKRGRSFESAREITMNCIVKATSALSYRCMKRENENGNSNSSDEADKLISSAREKSRCTTKQQEREKEAAQQNSKRERKKPQKRAQGASS